MSRRRTMEAILASDYVSIGELARLTGCRYSTLKHYTEEGMLPFEQEEENLTRRYRREQSIQLVEWIRQQRKAGRSVPEIASCRKSAHLLRAGIRILRDKQLPDIKVWGQK